MDTQSANTFVHIARLGSFTRAAEELHYAQSTVTMQMQRLEKELGYPLFERIGRKTQLTAEGREFLTYAERFLELAEGRNASEATQKVCAARSAWGFSNLCFLQKCFPFFPKSVGIFQTLRST